MSIRDDDHDVAHGALPCCRTVEAAHAGSSLALNDVSFQPLPVIDIDHGDLFVFDEVRSIHEIFINGEAAYIVEVGFSNDRTMYFRFEYFYLHSCAKLIKTTDLDTD